MDENENCFGPALEDGVHRENSENGVLFKVLVIGDVGVGKSSVLQRFVENVFDCSYGATIGVDFKTTKLNLRGKLVKLQIWDTAGHERFRTMTSAFYRGAHGVVLMYDVTRIETFSNIPKWLKDLDIYDCHGFVKILFGNKTDLDLQRTVPRDMAFKYADSNNMFLFETSAKTGDQVHEAFEYLIERMLALFSQKASTCSSFRIADFHKTLCMLSGQHSDTSGARRGCSC